MYHNQLTHGFLENSTSKDKIFKIKTKVDQYLRCKDYPTYTSAFGNIVPEVFELISDNLISLIRELLFSDFIKLENVELHYLPPSSEPIPPHQDNFYHCIEDGVGLKVLIPLTELSIKSGGLCYLNCTSDIGVLEHTRVKSKFFFMH